ncbi:iron dicitrate transport regulator FecR [Caulobacter segnis]|uniref:Anti-FecI sigma factor, FecR n=2 Tax=Caulobacter segnis TaxID=88688 RepID=D5VJB0_CAUST|nr:FecR domain-containing protein [Caulobacter segnis]ADG10319.1 anti-FecI sigma factor, FecR [Caulobacter segnis ATCC 21756]AVQ02052.1 iron dicitrate transport regulator FecR [Caulobacter segnis]
MSPSASEIDDEAALWAVRIDARGLDAATDPELEAWLAGDARRAGALLRAQAAISFLDRGRALAGSTPPIERRGSSRRALIFGGAVVAAAVGGAGLWKLRPQRLDTGLGEIRRVPLADGSMVAINTSSALEVELKPKAREILLKQGEAWFQVAKDPERPFVVAAGPVRVRAVGTAFSVRRREQDGSSVDVMVTEGVVEAWVEGVDAPRQRLSAGNRLVLAGATTAPITEAPLDIERSLAWRNGEIALDGESLEEAARLFNRYNSRQIVIDDPELAKERFVGLFQTNAPESFASAVAATLGAEVSVDARAIRIGRARAS